MARLKSMVRAILYVSFFTFLIGGPIWGVLDPKIIDLRHNYLETQKATFGCPRIVGAGLYGTYMCIAFVPIWEEDVYNRKSHWILMIGEDRKLLLLINSRWSHWYLRLPFLGELQLAEVFRLGAASEKIDKRTIL